STYLRDQAYANASVSVSTNESSNTRCGCSTSYTVSASAGASLVDLYFQYGLNGSGNIPIIASLYRSLSHEYAIDRSVSKSSNSIGSMNGSAGWSGSWTTSVEEYGSPNSYRIYNMAGGSYRHSSLIAISRYSPSSSLSTYAYASVSITHNPDEFTCNCSKCGDSCSCSISATSSAYAHAYLRLMTKLTGGELILRAGLARMGGGWLKPVFNRLVCNNYGCIWYSNRDPWNHSGDLSIDWFPTYPLPGQRVNITITFGTGDSQPVRLWVYRVVEKVWVNGHVRVRTYSLHLVTSWEISEVLHGWKYVSHSLKMIADPGHAKISFTWKMPNGYLTICAAGWGIFTRLINKCWIITPPIVIVDIFPIRVLPIFKNGNVAGYHGLVTLQDIVAPREVFWYGVLVRVFVPDKYTITLSVPSSFTIVDYSVNSIRPISSSGPISVSRYFRTGLWLILYPAGVVLPYRGRLQVVYVNNVSVVTYLAPSLGPRLDYATYRMYATVSNYFIYHELLAVSRIVLTHIVSSYYMLQHYILPIVKWAICLESPGAVECHGDPYVLGRAYMLELYCPHNIVLQYASWSWYNSDIATRYITDLACRFYHVACSYPIGASAIAEPSPVVIRSLVGSYCRLKLLDTYLPAVSRYVKYSIRGVYVRTIGRIYRVELHDDTVGVCCHICKILLVEKVCRYGMLCIVARTSEGISEAYINIVRLTRSSIYVTARLMPTILDEVLLAETYRTYMRVG
ncbi:MAG: hypothetical protein GXO26_00770, partial [Crenarchaeota archaeon]|nr:hypothetical protein [Thermoproteota archaeon]